MNLSEIVGDIIMASIEDIVAKLQETFAKETVDKFSELIDQLDKAGSTKAANDAVDAFSIALAKIIYEFSSRAENPGEVLALMMKDVMETTFTCVMKNLSNDENVSVTVVTIPLKREGDEMPEQNAPSTNTVQ